MDKFTEKYRGINVIPMRQSRFYPDWMLITRDGQTQYLSGHAADRLAAYEDTGYTPEEIEEFDAGLLAAYKETGLEPEEIALYKEAQEISESMAPGRLIELAQADRVGRLVVLPEGTVSMLMTHFVDEGGKDMVTPAAEARGDENNLFALLSIAVSAVAQAKKIDYKSLLSAMMAHPPLGRLKLGEAEAAVEKGADT